MLKYIAVTFYFFITFPGLIAQSNIYKHIGRDGGLSNNHITDIIQDGKGFIWIATEAGLNRFDGKNFTVYTKNSGIVSNELNTLLYDKEENTIWIGSQREGISVFDCKTHSFKNYSTTNGLLTNDVTHLSHAADGGIWITHYHAGIEYYNKKTKKFILFADRDIKGLKSLNWCACDDGNGNLYVGHSNDGLSIIDIKSRTTRNIRNNPLNPKSLPGNTVRSIYMDHQKNIWVGTNRGLALFNPQNEEFITFNHDPNNTESLGSDNIYNINELKDGTLWVSTGMAGISILNLKDITLVDPQKVKFQNMLAAKDNHRLSSPDIRCIFQDSFDNIWIGHYRKGIDLISNIPPIFKILSFTTDIYEETNEKQIWDICTDPHGQLWVGSENKISVFRNNELKKTIDIRSYLSTKNPNIYINKIESDKNGNIWVGTNNDGIFKVNSRTYQIEVINFKKSKESVHSFWEEADGKILIGTENGIYSYRQDKIHIEQHLNDQLTDKTVYNILRDRNGKLWVGTFGKGIFVFDKNDVLISNLETGNGFCSNAISSLFLDSNGGIWAATRNGLAYFEDINNPSHYEVYNEKQDLENSYIWAIEEDNLKNIWISTNAGISRWNKEEKKFSNYNYEDGVPIGDFTSGSSKLGKDGILYFGSLNNICYFNPMELAKVQQPISAVQIIECVTLSNQIENNNNKILTPSAENEIYLAYDQNSFRISFSVPDFSRNQQVEYAYMMEGFDNSWHNTQGDNQVSFRNIPHGNYTFKVKSRLKNQSWDETNIASLNFNIQPPLWLTWYAKVLYVVLVCVIIYFLLRSYNRRINLKTSLEFERKNNIDKQALNDERLRFYTNITHELRTPLTLILGPLEDLIHDKNLPDLYNKKINTIHASAIRLLNLINQILEFRKTETQNRKLTVAKGNIANLVKEIGLHFKELNQNDKVNILIETDSEDSILYFDVDMVTSILNNLLSNAIKYTPTGEIRLTLHAIKEKGINYTEIKVSDTGYGIEAEDLPRIFDRYYQVKNKHQSSGTGIGLSLVKSLVELHEGILSVESTIGKGTTFSVCLLSENTYLNAIHHENKEKTDSIDEDTDIIKENEDSHPVILVIEDDRDIREYITTSLDVNYSILSATNGKEGLALAQKYIPNIVISDIMMPEMDGIEFCRIIKGDMRTSHIPVILLTAKDTIQDREEGYESGADSFLTKPFSARLLHSRILNLLESRKKLTEQISAYTRGVIALKEDKKENPLKISKLDEEFLSRLTEIIENNIEMEDLDIAFIKEKMNMSYSTFYRKLKGLTNMSPNEFIRKIRLRNSIQLLLTGSYNISEVAYMSGFNDVVYFRKCFKEEYGMAPSEYIKNFQNKSIP